MADFKVENHGTVFLVQPLNVAAQAHLEENVEEDAQWFSGALVVEHRFIGGLVSSLREDGWEVE